MATLKQRLHKKNSSGTYDVIHLETSSDLVKLANGTTLTSKLSTIDSDIIGRVLRKAVYYSNNTVSADTITDSCALLNLSGSVNSTLYGIIGETYCYIIQFYYSDNGQRVQLALGYTKANMALRSSYSGSWCAWNKIYSANSKPTLADIGAAASSHNHAAGDITSGTLAAARIPTLAASKIGAGTFAATGVVAAVGTDYTTARVRNAQASTSDLTAGSSSLANGNIYLVYE